ncbi:MAG TPA: hypothetical protein VJN94_05045 [Candidatus Binataceae bacterium]|nr:hypothetical protein [Candidatus Binataceae bacterium]
MLAVALTRLKSSFIYLANAVTDLRVNWRTFAVVLAPLVLLGAFCLLPDALNLQRELAEKFAPGTHNVGWGLAQEPYMPSLGESKPLVPWWLLLVFHLTLVALAFGVNLVVLCTIRRDRAGVKKPQILDEAVAIYREAGTLALAFYWVVFLQLCVPLIAIIILRAAVSVPEAWMLAAIYIFEVALTLFAALVYLWLYFARYALVFDGRRSFHGLLFSRDLMRKRFFRVATRIVVFLAVWSGYNSWAAASFVFVSVVLGPVGALTGYLWATIFVLDLGTTTVTYLTAAFFAAAGVRLYHDVAAIAGLEDAPRADEGGAAILPPTEALSASG